MKTGTVNDCNIGELPYKIGSNSQENWDLIDSSKENDVWFHLDDSPSCHVVLSLPENVVYKDVSKQTLIKCGSFCKKKGMKNVDVIYAEIKNVTKADTVGSVNTKNAKKITIS